MNYRIGKSFTWPGMDVHLEIASLQIGDEGQLDPIAEAACKMTTSTLQFFAIFPTVTGAFAPGVAPGHTLSSAATLCLQHYQVKTRHSWLKARTLTELVSYNSSLDDLKWEMTIVPWPAKNDEEGEAIFIISGTDKDLQELAARLAKETKDE